MSLKLKQQLSGFGKLMANIGTALSFLFFIIMGSFTFFRGWNSDAWVLFTSENAMAVLIMSSIPIILSSPILLNMVLGLIFKKEVKLPEEKEIKESAPVTSSVSKSIEEIQKGLNDSHN